MSRHEIHLPDCAARTKGYELCNLRPLSASVSPSLPLGCIIAQPPLCSSWKLYHIQTNKINPFRYRLSDSTNSTMHRSGGLWGFAALRLHSSARHSEHNASWWSMGWWSLASAAQGRRNNPGWGTRAEKKIVIKNLITTLTVCCSCSCVTKGYIHHLERWSVAGILRF